MRFRHGRGDTLDFLAHHARLVVADNAHVLAGLDGQERFDLVRDLRRRAGVRARQHAAAAGILVAVGEGIGGRVVEYAGFG
jgi:hypothetical protein